MTTLPDIVVRAEIYKNDLSLPCTLFFTYPDSDVDALECGVLLENENLSPNSLMLNDKRGKFLQVRSTDKTIWIPKFRLNEYRVHKDKSIRGKAQILFEGMLDYERKDNESIECHILLQNNALVNLMPLSWITPFGNADVISDYRNPSINLKNDENDHNKKSMILIMINSPKYESLNSLFLELTDYLDNLMWLLSFLCKKYVHWHQIDITFRPKSYDGFSLTTIRGYRDPVIVKWNRDEMRNPAYSNNLLVNPKVLSQHSEKIFTQYYKSDLIINIQKLITMIMTTFTVNFHEQDVAFMYIILEALVDNFSKKENLLKGKKYKKIKEVLTIFLDSDAAKILNYSQAEKTNIVNKLSEFKRSTYITRLNKLLKPKLLLLPPKMSIDVTPQNLMDELPAIISRRNKFTHQGTIEDRNISMGDIALIRFIVSIWILDILGYPLNEINKDDSDIEMYSWAKHNKDSSP